jgi:hypothetical protein
MKKTSSSKPENIHKPVKKGQLEQLMTALGKKPKISTLEKSRLDWNRYVAQEQMEDELKQQRKDGYLERMAFLQRTAEREHQVKQPRPS